MKDVPLWYFFSLTMRYLLLTICFQMVVPAKSHPHTERRLETHTSLEQYPIIAQAAVLLFCILLATKVSLSLFLLPSFCPSSPMSTPLPPQKERGVCSCLIIGSQAPILKLSMQQWLDLEDRSQQNKISRKYYSRCGNMINDMLRPVSK